MPRATKPVFGAAPVESFTIVMATGIVAVAAREDEHPVVALALAVPAGCGLVAVVAWVLLVINVAASAHSGWAAIRAGARGSWLLVVVALHSLVLVAARLAVTVGTASGSLLVVSVVGWVSGVLGYSVIAVLVV